MTSGFTGPNRRKNYTQTRTGILQLGETMKIKSAVLAVLFCALSALSHAQATDQRLMTDTEYKIFLSQVEVELPKWQSTLKSIDLEKAPHLPYSQGKSIEDSQIVALTEVDNLRAFISLQRRKRTVQGELGIMMFLNNLLDESEEIMWRGAVNGLPSSPLDHLDQYGPEINEFSKTLFTDIQERVSILEKSTCP